MLNLQDERQFSRVNPWFFKKIMPSEAVSPKRPKKIRAPDGRQLFISALFESMQKNEMSKHLFVWAKG